MKKWLSYRERPLLGRAKRRRGPRGHRNGPPDRGDLLLELALDAGYGAVKAATVEWAGLVERG